MVQKYLDIKYVLFLFFIFYSAVSFYGYGNDNDTYGMLKSGQNLLLNFEYIPSRFQGSLVPEIIMSAASLIGGYYLSNSISVALGLGTLYIFYFFLNKKFSKPEAILITLTVGFNPYFVIASSSSMDYIYGLFFIFLGSFFLFKNFRLFAAIAFAFALASRLSNALLVGLIYLYFLFSLFQLNKKEFIRLFLSGLFALILTLTFYFPTYSHAGYTFSFLSYAIGDWSLLQYLQRFVYKNMALFGTLTTLLIYISFIYYTFSRKIKIYCSKLLCFILSAFVIEELLFLKIPLEISYLLPIIFLVIPVYVFFIKLPYLRYTILLLTILYNFLNIDFVKAEYAVSKSEATGGKIGLFFKPGIVLDDIQRRSVSQADYFHTFNLPMQQKK